MTSPGPSDQLPADLAKTVAAFEACTLPLAEWQQHATHLRVAMWYLLHLPSDEAAQRIQAGIQHYNRSQGTEQTPTGGYHETITLAFIHLIRHFLAHTDRRRPLSQIADDLVAEHGSKQALLPFYSRDRLLSWEARTGWVGPDLQSLPELPV